MSKTSLYKVHYGQSWVDISLKIYGTPDYAFELSFLNQSNITEAISAGALIEFIPDLKANKTILTIYENNQTNPANYFSAQDKQIFNKEEGISIWAINLDFAVSKERQ